MITAILDTLIDHCYTPYYYISLKAVEAGFGERENEYEGHKFTILRSEYAEIYGIRFNEETIERLIFHSL